MKQIDLQFFWLYFIYYYIFSVRIKIHEITFNLYFVYVLRMFFATSPPRV